MFPDEIVCCGPASVFVPYTDPGLKLAQTIRRETEAFIQKQQRQPRVILMQNHGIITLGATWQAVLSCHADGRESGQNFRGRRRSWRPRISSPGKTSRASPAVPTKPTANAR